jgi:hypothetical protein
VLRPSATFQFSNFTVDNNSVDWTTIGETPKYLFYVEHFVNGNWLAIKKFRSQKYRRRHLFPARHAQRRRQQVPHQGAKRRRPPHVLQQGDRV